MGSARILILSEHMRGTSFALTAEKYTIGRSESSDICIADPTISGHHCTLTLQEDGRYAIQDEGSTNGTKVNENKLGAEPVVLTNGDILQVGGIEVLFDNREDFKAESRTLTVINLEDTGTSELNTASMKNLGAKFSSKKSYHLRDNSSQNKIILIVIGVLALIGLVVLGVFLSRLLGNSQPPA